MIILTGVFLASCEGPAGPAGADGKDANETCKLCHNPTVVDQKVVEFDFSKHKYGEAAFEEGREHYMCSMPRIGRFQVRL